jgi:hypothetical protein
VAQQQVASRSDPLENPPCISSGELWRFRLIGLGRITRVVRRSECQNTCSEGASSAIAHKFFGQTRANPTDQRDIIPVVDKMLNMVERRHVRLSDRSAEMVCCRRKGVDLNLVELFEGKVDQKLVLDRLIQKSVDA